MKHLENPMHIGNGESTQQCGQPRRYKLALLTFVGLLAPVYFVPPALSAVLVGPRLLTVSAAVAVIVALMSYVIMPVLKYLTGNWLCEQPSRKS
jgi:antibiotic biosynthesis monooxygenase (ABM) superfamily enzyme